VTLKSIRFVGNTRLTAEQLGPVVQRYLNQPQTFSQLQQAAQDISVAYRDAGWLVRAYLPKQDLGSGELTIQIIEAVFSGVTLEGADSARVRFAQIARIFQKQQGSGQPVNVAALDRALLLADDLPGVAVAGSLVAGQQDGETGLSVKLLDEPRAIGDASLDNTGSRSTGSDRLSANLSFNSPLGRGDLLSASATHTQGSDYLRLAATVPVGSDGWRVGANASTLTYHIISPEFAALNSLGDSGGLGLEANYPLVRARTRNLYLSLAVDQKSFHNESNAAVQSDYNSRSTSIGLSGNLFDSLGGGGANSASLTLTEGSTALGHLDASENAALEGSFSKLRYALSRQQVITADVSLYAALSGQHASQTLDSSEKFTLGGSSGVRAYPSSEGSGSRGQLLNLELRARLPKAVVLTGFYDWGSVSNFDTSPSYSLQGAGLSVNWQSANGINLKAVWAHRLGSNPNPTATGKDQDGSLSANRFWLNASLTF
jgi:hemolysin activation/secretion protein